MTGLSGRPRLSRTHDKISINAAQTTGPHQA